MWKVHLPNRASPHSSLMERRPLHLLRLNTGRLLAVLVSENESAMCGFFYMPSWRLAQSQGLSNSPFSSRLAGMLSSPLSEKASSKRKVFPWNLNKQSEKNEQWEKRLKVKSSHTQSFRVFHWGQHQIVWGLICICRHSSFGSCPVHFWVGRGVGGLPLPLPFPSKRKHMEWTTLGY